MGGACDIYNGALESALAALAFGLIPLWSAMRAPVAGVKMAKHKMWFNPDRAIRELGLPQTPPEQAFADAVAWFRANGYVKK